MDKINNRDATIAFLAEVGIPATEGDVPTTSFLPNITIKDGAIIYNKNTHVSDILHEAGHLACIPGKYRNLCQSDMGKNQRKIWDIAEAAGEIEIDSPTYRALIQSSDPEATAWAWAAGRHLGIADEEIILDHQYEGTGEDIRTMLSIRGYFGINGLRAAGMVDSVRTFPEMTRWVQP